MNIFNKIAIVAGFGVAVAFGGTFTNGSFEDPGGNTPGIRCIYDNAGCAATGWTTAGGLQVWESAPNDGISSGADGIFWVSFGHSGATGGTLEQTFDTVIGNTYSVAFSLIVQQGADPESVLAEALDGTTTIASSSLTDFTNPDWFAGPGFNFTAISTSTTLRFTDTTVGGGSANWGLDAVTVGPAIASAPEPASLMLIGGALVGLRFRRQRARR
jgi:hypothetical protein